jgi:hypothetical protein
MLYNLILWLTLGLCFGLIAAVYSAILTEPEMLLNPWYNWLDRKLGPSSKQPIQGPLQVGVSRSYGLPRAMWLFKLLIGCPRCVAGQAGVWLCLLVVVTEPIKYSFFGHLLAASASIFSVSFYHKFYKWSRNL